MNRLTCVQRISVWFFAGLILALMAFLPAGVLWPALALIALALAGLIFLALVFVGALFIALCVEAYRERQAEARRQAIRNLLGAIDGEDWPEEIGAEDVKL